MYLALAWDVEGHTYGVQPALKVVAAQLGVEPPRVPRRPVLKWEVGEDPVLKWEVEGNLVLKWEVGGKHCPD